MYFEPLSPSDVANYGKTILKFKYKNFNIAYTNDVFKCTFEISFFLTKNIYFQYVLDTKI